MQTTLMLAVLLLVLVEVVQVNSRSPFRSQFVNRDLGMRETGQDPGLPLFVTPYIEKGDIQTAVKLSQVQISNSTWVQEVDSYSGFFTVNKKDNSNMFFWFFPAQEGTTDAPVLLWLQGGPGGSSLFGLFNENGPFYVDKDMNLMPRKYAWTSKFSVLYIDNPVGTGFSFTDSPDGYAKNESDVAENLYSAFTQFFAMFPSYQKNDFYLTGESYAGKYIPAAAYKIHMMGSKANFNFKGVAIGDGFSDPPVMISYYADYLFQIGMLDELQKAHFQAVTDSAVKLIKQKQFKQAYHLWNDLLNGDISTVPSYFTNVTGSTDYFNFLRTQSPADFQYHSTLLVEPSMRHAIHVGNLTYHSGDKVEEALINDILDTVKPWLATVMDNYKVLVYSGQLDIIVALPLTEAMLQTVPWKGLEAYKKAERLVWKVDPHDTEVAGYIRKVGSFYQAVVRGGGHILPYDQPLRTFDLINRFITDQPFHK